MVHPRRPSPLDVSPTLVTLHGTRRTLAIISILVLAAIMTILAGSNHTFGVLSTNAFPLQSATSNNPVFSLLVTLEFSGEAYKAQFLKDIEPVAAYCKANEAGTLAYEVLLSDKDPLQVLLLERYQDKEVAYLQVHKSSTLFLEVRSKLQAMQEGGHVRISGHSYLDSGIGYGDRV